MTNQTVACQKRRNNRRVALLKSLATNNRFYVLVSPESGLKNADVVETFPEDVLLGIAYPCLEDGLNDFAIIRSTFETIDQFPDDQELRKELMEIITDAQGKLICRFEELCARIADGRAVLLGTDLNEFKNYIINLATKGVPRKTLDSMMKLDVFETVATTEALLSGKFEAEFMYVHEFTPEHSLETLRNLPPRVFLHRVFQDVLASIKDPANYQDKHTFDRNVFQKFIALMFVNYATTDPVFYGTNKADYGVSTDKEMDSTPLYIAVGKALRELEGATLEEAAPVEEEAVETRVPTDLSLEQIVSGAVSRTIELSNLPIADQQILGHMTQIAETARILVNLDSPRSRECGELVLRATHRLFLELREMGILSPAADSPVDPNYQN